jgi:hypothetical protein
MEIRSGDYVFITDGKSSIYKTVFGKKLLALKPNNFYKVIGTNNVDVFVCCEKCSGIFIRIKLDSVNFNKLTFVKKEDFEEIEDLDFFEDVL